MHVDATCSGSRCIRPRISRSGHRCRAAPPRAVSGIAGTTDAAACLQPLQFLNGVVDVPERDQPEAPEAVRRHVAELDHPVVVDTRTQASSSSGTWRAVRHSRVRRVEDLGADAVVRLVDPPFVRIPAARAKMLKRLVEALTLGKLQRAVLGIWPAIAFPRDPAARPCASRLRSAVLWRSAQLQPRARWLDVENGIEYSSGQLIRALAGQRSAIIDSGQERLLH